MQNNLNGMFTECIVLDLKAFLDPTFITPGAKSKSSSDCVVKRHNNHVIPSIHTSGSQLSQWTQHKTHTNIKWDMPTWPRHDCELNSGRLFEITNYWRLSWCKLLKVPHIFPLGQTQMSSRFPVIATNWHNFHFCIFMYVLREFNQLTISEFAKIIKTFNLMFFFTSFQSHCNITRLLW